MTANTTTDAEATAALERASHEANDIVRIGLISKAVHNWEKAKLRATQAAREEQDALWSLRQLLNAHGRTRPASPPVKQYVLRDTNGPIPKKWMLAFALLKDPIVDYVAMGQLLYAGDPKLDNKQLIKCRITSLLYDLARNGVVERLTSNTFRVDRERLVIRSGLKIPEDT